MVDVGAHAGDAAPELTAAPGGCGKPARSSGFHEFGLAEDFAASQFRKAAQANERSVTDVTINPMVA